MGKVGFWRELKQDNRSWSVQSNRLGSIGRPWYLFPQGNGPRGSFATFTELAPNLRSRDVIIFGGVLLEQAVTPQDVFDVTMIGAANRPRQATDGGVATGGGASWLAPASPTASTPLLKIREQGWSFENIMFQPVASSACLQFSRAETAADMDGSHGSVVGCYFVGGGSSGIGIEDVGGCSRILIDGNRFELLTGTAIKGISTGIAIPSGWQISNNRFNANSNAIAMSLTEGLVCNNYIRQTVDSSNKVNLISVSSQGSLNQVIENVFPDVAANVTIAKGYKPGTTDVWRNFVTDTAAYIVTVPS